MILLLPRSLLTKQVCEDDNKNMAHSRVLSTLTYVGVPAPTTASMGGGMQLRCGTIYLAAMLLFHS